MADEEYAATDPYNPGDPEREYIGEIFENFDTGDQCRKIEYPELDNMNPMRYVDESRMRAAGYLPKQYETDYNGTLGANVFFGKTRNKRNIIASFIAAQRPRAEISTYGHNATMTDKRIAMIGLNAYNHFMLLDNADETYLDWTLETLDTGFGVLMEYYDYQEMTFKTVTKVDWDTGKKQYKDDVRVTQDRPRCKVIPFEQLFFPTLHETDIQNYPWIIYREYILREKAEQIYGKFPNWKHVPNCAVFTQEGRTGEQFFYNRWSERVQDPYVEIIHRFKKVPDTHDILINGVLMTEIGNPMLYDHKEYPFVPQYFEKIKGFILGKSLPMKIMYAQDAYNDHMNSNLNRSKSSSHISFLSSMESQIEQDSVGLWEIIKTDDDANLRELKVQSVSQGDISMTNELSAEIDESTVDKSMSGQISGETATAIMNAVRQSIQNLGPQLIYAYSATSKHAELRLKNIFQFFFNKGLKGEHFEQKDINIEDVKLSDGQKGVMIIRVVDGGATKNCGDKCKRPTEDAYQQELMKGAIDTIGSDGKKKQKVETNYDIVYITPDDIADIQSKIKIIPGSSLPDIQSLDKALLVEMINTGSSPLLQAYPDFLELWKLLAEKFGYNPDDITKPQDQSAAPAQQQQQAGAFMTAAPQAVQGAPAGNSPMIAQMLRGSSPSLNQVVSNAPTA